MFVREDWKLFMDLATLGQKAGVPRQRIAALVLKEIVDNALDAGANVKIANLGDGRYSVEDDGPGIDGTDEDIAHLFSVRRPLTSTKLLRLPMRGALGNGLRVVVGAIAASGGSLDGTMEKAAKRAKVATATPRGEAKVTLSSVIMDLLPEAIRTASGHGSHRFSLRNLYYAVRPLVLATRREEPTYKYFGDVITDVEAGLGHDIPRMYRDARGMLYMPHGTGEQLSLGTLNVESYIPPKHKINKVLYIEKGGFLPLLLDTKWPERHDCAILTSQGFATRAARDMIDLLGERDEPIRFFCVHDADGPGTLIHEKIVEATRARGARKVEVVNLGLDPWEAEDMGLLAETVDRKSGSVPVADYVRRRWSGGRDWASWLQTGRYELNAMMPPDLLEWLDAKMEKHGDGKVVPPADYLGEQFDASIAKQARDHLIRDLITRYGIEDRVRAFVETHGSKSLDRDPEASSTKSGAGLRGPIRLGMHRWTRSPLQSPRRSL